MVCGIGFTTLRKVISTCDYVFYVFIGAQMCTDASNEWQRYVICLLNSQIMILVTGMVGYHERILGVFDCICICHNNRL